MNKLGYIFIFLILISLFPCYGILANEETNNVPSQEITESIEKKNVTENVTENESKENHVNIKPQKKENIFIQIMKWLGFIILIAVIAFVIAGVLEANYDCDGLGLIIAIIYFILSIALKASFKISFFWSAIIPIFFPLSIFVWKAVEKRKRIEEERIELIERIDMKLRIKNRKIEEFSRILLNANLAMIHKRSELRMFIDDYDDIEFCKIYYEEIRNRIEELRNEIAEKERLEAEEQRQQAEIEKQLAYEQIQNEAAEQTKANEDAMKKNEVERNIDELSDYIDMLGVSIQKKELPDVRVVSELSKMLDLIFNNKSYIAKEDFNKIRNDNEVFVKHVLGKCSELENFSGSLLETRMKQVEAKFDEILK